MIISRAFRLMLAAGVACLAPNVSAAQGITFPGIGWGDPADSVRARLQARGFTFQSQEDGGDHLYRRADSAWLRVDLRDGRAIGVVLVDLATPGEVSARFQVLADSLQAVMGEPDEEETGTYRTRSWVAGLESLQLRVNPAGGRRQVELAWRGPGWYDEMARRGDEPPVPAGFTIVSATPFLRIAIDTTISRRGSPDLRGRFRIEYRQPITPSVDGVAQPPIDVVEYEMDVDCAGRRTRLVARATFLEGRRLSSHRPEGQPWGVPAPDGHYARGRDAVCRAARRRT
ncbi:MAG TPA: hypothetical protein VFR37_16380 [Longimicrobium sp.]|nr:hypothetical protein [Longimicrobium sp.]